MDQFEFLKSMPAEIKTHLTETSNWIGIRQLVLHLSVLTLLALWVAFGVWGWRIGFLGLGIAWVFLFTLQHECTHDTPFKSKWINTCVGHVCAAVLVQPFLWFRYFHMAHHRHTNIPGKDPELHGDEKPESWGAFVWHLSTLGYWHAKIQTLWSNAMGHVTDSYIPDRAIPKIRREARALWMLYLLVLTAMLAYPVIFWIWLGPILVGFPVLRLYLLAEHGRCQKVSNMFKNTRTTRTTRLVRALTWNMPYHVEHHVFPTVPFHKLPTLHAYTQAHIQHLDHGYAAFAKSYVAEFKANKVD